MRAPAGPALPQPTRAPALPAPTITPDLTPPTAHTRTQSAAATATATTTATTTTAPTPPPTNEHADAAYRDLLTRVREEREQLGQIISHPF